ncbi:tight adherence protein B [Loktanella sp. DSM 29012]|uniref:type II secretion system F family protein n=1 Tax=Loktanella sp. DSM 29012 TaxID=1881056 RepID=UPI0008D75D06|nr:type II secretion system F family protein [Loktanella sp. DSM 29012]SEQ77617.1 tight adherence protein B [Loktanella sp. DSM 29012]
MPTLILTFLGGFVVYAVLALVAVIMADRLRRRHLDRLLRARPDTGGMQVEETMRAAKRKAASDTPPSELSARLARHMARAGLEMTVRQAMIQGSLVAVAVYGLGTLVLGLHPLAALILAAAMPVLLGGLVLRVARARYIRSFTNDLPEALDVFARGLRAGRPVADSLTIVVESSTGGLPILREFTRARDEMRMGNSLPDTLDRLNRRIPTAEVAFFAVATALQTETGGNLIETMENLAKQLRDRRQLRRKARALSSEARASAMILAALPFAVALLIGFLNPTYLGVLFTDPRGQVMATVAVASIGLGIMTMVRMGKLNV